ncbi:MAG: hypothetical protein ACI9XP_000876 [Lentimonas sp.]|jgi:hypothetical protein
MNKFGLLVIYLTFCLFGWSQIQKPRNYFRFDERIAHFGFMMGGNSSDFQVFPKVNAYNDYGLISVKNKSTNGGQIAMVSTFRLINPVLRLRFLPGLSFQEKVLVFSFESEEEPGEIDVFEERIAMTNLDFPLMLQFRTTRFNNFATYVLAGGMYSLDLQSQQDKSQSLINPFIKLKRDDFQIQGGVGVEFFAPYFKFGMEIKYSQGMINSFIQDNTKVSNPIEMMRNKIFWLSFIFEG